MKPTIQDYLNNHTFQYWLNENFDCDEIQDQLDSIAADDLYPEQFIQWCYDALNFDQEKTMYPILPTACGLHNIVPEEEEIDHEFHFWEPNGNSGMLYMEECDTSGGETDCHK